MMLDKQEIRRWGGFLLLLALADWNAFLAVCKLMLALVGGPLVMLLLFAAIALLYLAAYYFLAVLGIIVSTVKQWIFN